MVRSRVQRIGGSVSEQQWQKLVTDYARLHGWKRAHFRPAPTGRSGKWVTPVALDGAGFPDLVLARQRPPGLLFVELKTDRGVLSAGQAAWLAVLTAAGARAVVWRPRQWGEVQQTLGESE